ncbi:MAG: hypothetical protein ACTSWN_10435 [Promethearchaeota archaeon]
MHLKTSTIKVVIFCISLGMVVFLPIMRNFLLDSSKINVHVNLGQPMYTLNGEEVQSIDLKPASAEILLYRPNRSGTVHDEKIRPGKSIRLGGYFYSLGGVSVDDAIDWIGNNCDVFSLGLCGSVFEPEDIMAIRNINDRVKFYYMTFATTLFEDFSATNDNSGTWGNTHYPYVGFNDTMREWTLKYNNGSEAIGVRRQSNNSSAHLMDLGNPGWADYFAYIYDKRCEQYHADGVAIDEVMWRGYWGTKVEDLRDYNSLDEIIDSCYSWLERIDSKMTSEIITQAFWDDAQVYQDGIWGEIAFRAGGQYGERVNDMNATVWYESMNWFGIVENMLWHSSRNRSYIWAAWYEDVDGLKYSIATYLMGRAGNSFSLVFHPHDTSGGGYPESLVGYSLENVINEVNEHPEIFQLEIGDPLGPMQIMNGEGGKYVMRPFENGIVLVNPYHPFLPGLE